MGSLFNSNFVLYSTHHGASERQCQVPNTNVSTIHSIPAVSRGAENLDFDCFLMHRDPPTLCRRLRCCVQIINQLPRRTAIWSWPSFFTSLPSPLCCCLLGLSSSSLRFVVLLQTGLGRVSGLTANSQPFRFSHLSITSTPSLIRLLDRQSLIVDLDQYHLALL